MTHRKRLFYRVLPLGLAACLLSAQAATFRGKGYSLKVPDSWQSRKVPGVDVALAAPGSGGPLPASLNVTVTPLPAAMKVTLTDLQALMLKQGREAVRGFKLVSDNSLTVGGQPGHELSFSGTQQGIPMRWVQRVTLRANVAYIVTFGVTQAAFDKNRAAAGSILDSFTLTGSGR